jgi:excisionase family DNA binding protein
MPELINAAAAAKILGVSKPTVYRYAQDGRIPSVKLNEGGPGAVRFDPKEIEKYINKRRRAAL